jgi:hypothetical protein
MLHIRVVSPASATGLLLARLAVLPGIQTGEISPKQTPPEHAIH